MLGLKITAPAQIFELIKYKRKQQRKIDELKMGLQVLIIWIHVPRQGPCRAAGQQFCVDLHPMMRGVL